MHYAVGPTQKSEMKKLKMSVLKHQTIHFRGHQLSYLLTAIGCYGGRLTLRPLRKYSIYRVSQKKVTDLIKASVKI